MLQAHGLAIILGLALLPMFLSTYLTANCLSKMMLRFRLAIQQTLLRHGMLLGFWLRLLQTILVGLDSALQMQSMLVFMGVQPQTSLCLMLGLVHYC